MVEKESLGLREVISLSPFHIVRIKKLAKDKGTNTNIYYHMYHFESYKKNENENIAQNPNLPSM